MNRKIKNSESVAAIVVIGLLFSPALIADEFDEAYKDGYKVGYEAGYQRGLKDGEGGGSTYDRVGFYYREKSDEWQPYEFVESINEEFLVESGRSIEYSTAIEKYKLNSDNLNSYLDSVINSTNKISIDYSYPNTNILVLPDMTN